MRGQCTKTNMKLSIAGRCRICLQAVGGYSAVFDIPRLPTLRSLVYSTAGLLRLTCLPGALPLPNGGATAGPGTRKGYPRKQQEPRSEHSAGPILPHDRPQAAHQWLRKRHAVPNGQRRVPRHATDRTVTASLKAIVTNFRWQTVINLNKA